MKRILASLLFLVLLFGGLQTRAWAAVTPPEKTASGVPGENPNKNTIFSPLLTVELQRDAEVWGPGTVLDVEVGPNLYTYVRQNPWSAFDPLGLMESLERQVPKNVEEYEQKERDLVMAQERHIQRQQEVAGLMEAHKNRPLSEKVGDVFTGNWSGPDYSQGLIESAAEIKYIQAELAAYHERKDKNGNVADTSLILGNIAVNSTSSMTPAFELDAGMFIKGSAAAATRALATKNLAKGGGGSLSGYRGGPGAMWVDEGANPQVFGVHWTRVADEAAIFNSGTLNPSQNGLIWFETATSKAQLKTVLRNGAAGTGARSNQTAMIVDLTGMSFRHGSLTNPVGGGVSVLRPNGIQITGNGGRGITWYHNTGVQQHINKVANFVEDGFRSY